MNKNCLVIGGTQGIGKAVCDLLSLSTWDCIAIGRGQCDMNLVESVDTYLKSFPQNITLDAIVFSHGEWFSKPKEQHTLADYWRQYHSRVLMPIRIINYFANQLKQSTVGTVVFVSSTRGFIGGVDTAPYSLACGAQITEALGLSREYEGVFTSIVCPGLTDTPLGAEVIRTGGAKQGAPMNDPKTVAREIIKLIDERASGKVIRVVNNQASEAKWNW